MRSATVFLAMLVMMLPTAEAKANEVPTAMLSAKAGQQQSQVGTFCWTWTEFMLFSTGMCACGVGIVTSPTPLPVKPAEPLEINLPAGEGRANVELCWIYQSEKPKKPINQPNLMWTQELKDCRSFENVKNIKLHSPGAPGYYAMSVFAAWGPGKDAVHGFMLLVES